MSGFSSLTHKFRANLDSQQHTANKVSKRNRQPLSCAPCRIKKLKCDRGHPCDTCVKRCDQANCSYGKVGAVAAPAGHASEMGGNSNGGGGGTGNNRSRAQERLNHLEHLVKQMVETSATASASASASSDPSESPSSGPKDKSSTSSLAKEGHLQYGSSESTYVGSTHWSAILENIQELRTVLGSEQGRPSTTELDESEVVDAEDQDTLCGSTGNFTLEQILSQTLPPRVQVDRRMSIYFNSHYVVIPFIHTGQFMRQYEQFWRAPLDAEPLWISILFSICCISATLSEAVGSEPSTPEDQLSPRMSFLAGASHCLRLGGYLKPKRHVIEALALYAQCKYMATLDSSSEAGSIFPMLVRLAFRSGYHRDPSQFPNFSVFEGEMRRRTWAMMMQFDLMVSFQLGLPNQIPPDSWDTLPARNILDKDFDEDSAVLPPSRSENEATPLLYFIVKSRLMASFGKICSHALSFRDYPLSEIMELDAGLRKVYETVPPILRIRPMCQSYADPSYLVMQRVNCEFLYLKSLLVLHRKYMAQGNYPASSQACLDAATAITKHMLDLHKECKPGGQLYADRWMLSGFTVNDFYLAAMILCLGLSMWKKAHPGKDVSDDEEMEAQYVLLRSAFETCQELSPTNREAKRVADVLQVVFAGIEGGAGAGSGPAPQGANATRMPAIGPSVWTPQSHPTASAPPRTRFRGSAFFRTPYDVNLAPLTLEDQGPSVDANAISSSSLQAFESDQARDIADFNVGIHPLSFQAPSPGPGAGAGFDTTTPGQGLGSNPFLNFLPFNHVYPQNTQGSTNSDSTTNFDASPQRQHEQSMEGPLNVDVDWAFLDQWMALPSPDMVPLTEGSLPAATGGVSSPYPLLKQMTVTDAHAERLGASTDWTITPYMFIGEAGEFAPKGDGRDQDATMNTSPGMGNGSYLPTKNLWPIE